jgi:hypothetical protein
LRLESVKTSLRYESTRYTDCMHEAIAVVVVALFMVVATVVARLALRMIGRGSDREALRDFFAVPRRLSSDIGARRARRRTRPR